MQSIQATNTTLEDEQTSDMYSLGVVLWEILARRVRSGFGRHPDEDGGKGGTGATSGGIRANVPTFHHFA